MTRPIIQVFEAPVLDISSVEYAFTTEAEASKKVNDDVNGMQHYRNDNNAKIACMKAILGCLGVMGPPAAFGGDKLKDLVSKLEDWGHYKITGPVFRIEMRCFKDVSYVISLLNHENETTQWECIILLTPSLF